MKVFSKSIPYSTLGAQGAVHTESKLQRIKITVLGSRGVGKTSIVQQFVCNHFSEKYIPTQKRKCYYPSVIINEKLYDVKITDCPRIPYFPNSSLNEWSEFRGYGIRNATAYVLVFDVTNYESFQYIQSLRDQIIESRDESQDIPLLVVGNKYDLSEGMVTYSREAANIAKKQWKCAYVECSAKLNWRIISLFKELMQTIDSMDYVCKASTFRIQDTLRTDKCVIL